MVLRRTLTTDVNIYPYVAYMTFQNLIECISEPKDVEGGTKLMRSLKKKILSLDLGLALLHSIANICSIQQVGQIPQPPEDCCSILLSRGVYWWQSSVTTWEVPGISTSTASVWQESHRPALLGLVQVCPSAGPPSHSHRAAQVLRRGHFTASTAGLEFPYIYCSDPTNSQQHKVKNILRPTPAKQFCSITPDCLPLIWNICWNEVVLFELQPSTSPCVTVNESHIQIFIKKILCIGE